jgi:hypothetical protein
VYQSDSLLVTGLFEARLIILNPLEISSFFVFAAAIFSLILAPMRKSQYSLTKGMALQLASDRDAM